MALKVKMIISSMLLFVIAVGLNAMFNLNSFDKLYIERNVSEYRAYGKDLQRKIEAGLAFGKTLHNYLNIEALLLDAKKGILKRVVGAERLPGQPEGLLKADDVTISIVRPDGRVICSDNPKFIGTQVPHEAITEADGKRTGRKAKVVTNYIKYQNNYITTLPLKSKKKLLEGFIVISFKENQIKAFLERMYRQNIKPVFIISVSGLMLLMGLLFLLVPLNPGALQAGKKRYILIIFLVISVVQILTSALSTYNFRKHFLEVSRENNIIRVENLKRDISNLLGYGIRIDRLYRLEALMGKMVAGTPEIQDITVFDHNHQPLYRATQYKTTDFQTSTNAYDEWIAATEPVTSPEFNVQSRITRNSRGQGYISINASKTILFDKLADIAMDSLTVIVISILFLVELQILIFKYIEREVGGQEEKIMVNYGLMRPAAFMFLFGIDISISFLPLHMEDLYTPLFGLAKNTVLGLPISVEFMFVGIAILISGVWLDRRGWHEPFLGGLFLAGAGVLYSWLAPDALQFIMSRAVVGLGYGLSLMAAQGFVITFCDGKNKAQGLAHLFAGIYAGSICGGATGAMLAERVGYSPVFLSGAIILFSVAIYTLIFMRGAMKKPTPEIIHPALPKEKGARIYKFMFNRTILSLIFFSSLPAAIAVVGFLNYFSPIYLNRIGASQSTIGQVLMLYGICLIYFGPYISRYVDASSSKRLFIFLGCLLGSAAFLSFQVFDGLVAAIVAIVLLGFSSSLVLASQAVYALKLKVTQDLGEGKAIGIFRSTSRVGQMLGPIVFGSIIVATNINRSIMYIGITYLLTAFLFLFFSEKTTEHNGEKFV